MALYTLALAAAILISAIGQPEPIEEDAPEKTTLTLRHFWIREHDLPLLAIFEDAVAQFHAAHPHVKVNLEGMDQTVHREQKLRSEMVTGTPPDLFVLFGGAEIEPYVRAGRLMDLTDFVQSRGWQQQFHDLRLWTFDERIYGLPIEGNAEPLYYNKSIFDELGLSPPATLNELAQAIPVLLEEGYIPFALGNEDRWPAGIFAHYLMDRLAGPQLIEALIQGQPGQSFLNPAYERAMEMLDEWASLGAFGESPNALSGEEAIRLFTRGRAAMYLNGNWDITLFQNADAPLEFRNEVGVLPFPALEPGGGRAMAGGFTFGIGVSDNLSQAKRAAALELLSMLYTEEVQSRIVYEGLRIPSMRIPFDAARTGPIFAQVIDLMETSPYNFVPYDNILSPEVKGAFLQAVERILGRTAGPREALEQLQQANEQYWQSRSTPDEGSRAAAGAE